MAEEAKTEITSAWTAGGYRFLVSVVDGAVSVVCQSRGLTKEGTYIHFLSQVFVPPGNVASETERFVEHSFSFYGADVGELAVRVLRELTWAVAEAPDQTPMPTPVAVN